MDSKDIKMLCDLDTDGYAWNVFQQRVKLNENFDRNMTSYRFLSFLLINIQKKNTTTNFISNIAHRFKIRTLTISNLLQTYISRLY